MARVLVLAGSNSPEREVSLRSGAAVMTALQQAGHEVTQADTVDGFDSLLPLLQTTDAVFPAIHGAGGEDGALQKFLEAQGARFVGSGSEASALCYDKARYGELVGQHGFPLPTTALVDYQTFQQSVLHQQPFVLKPNDGGSSLGVIIVRDVSQIDEAAIAAVFREHPTMLLQQLITGAEITIAVVGEHSLPVIEIIPPESGEFDYENKYNGASQELCPPQHVAEHLQQDAQAMALAIHRLTGCRDMSRTDIIIDNNDTLWVLETNTIPGLTDQSLLPKAAATAGISMPRLCDRLVKAALNR